MTATARRHGVFADLPIFAKVATLSAALLLVGGALGAIALTSTRALDDAFHDYARMAEAAATAEAVDLAFLQTRRHAREYLLGNLEEAHAEVGRSVPVLKEALADARSGIDDPALATRVADMEKAILLYVADYEKAAAMKAEQHQLVAAVMDEAGEAATLLADAMEEAAETAGNAVLLGLASHANEQIMQARLEANKALSRGDGDHAEKVATAVAAVKRLLPDLAAHPDHAERAKALEAAVTRYAEAFARAIALRDDLAALVKGVMAKAAETIEADVAAVATATAAAEAELKAVMETTTDAARLEAEIALGLGLLGGIAASVLVGRGIARPIVRITDAMRRVADGDLETAVVDSGRRDEIGVMAGTLDVFKSGLAETLRLRREQEEEKRRAEERRRADMHALADRFEAQVGAIVEGVAAASTQLQGTAQALSAGAEEVSGQAIAVAAASEEANANVQTVAGAAEELSSSIGEIARQVQESADVATTAVRQAEATAARVRELSASAQKIGEVVSLIETIAGQTNLLALNATIEAARAGESGRGFAVVAAEVKELANQTARATGEIASQIAGIQASTEESAAAIGAIHGIIATMNGISSSIATAVDQQGAATKEIARNVHEASGATSEVARNIEGVTQASEISAAGAVELLNASTDLSGQARSLKQEMARFLASVRAA